MAKSRMTGFARLLIFLIIIIPLAYIGASFYNGEDGLQNLKNIFGGDKTTTTIDRDTRKDTEVSDRLLRLQEELDYKDKRIEELYQENEMLKREIEQLKNR